MKGLTSVVLAIGMAGVLAGAAGAAQGTTPPPTQTPVPRPFPGTKPPPATAKPAAPQTAGQTPATGPQDGGTIDPRLAGIQLYPGLVLLEKIDTGTNQWLYLLGTNDSYAGVLNFYKAALRKNGDEVSRQPAMHQFDIGSFDSRTMTYRPGVTVTDYLVPDPAGYLHVEGTVEKRYRTIVQIIPQAR
jgi:hypothetical protein